MQLRLRLHNMCLLACSFYDAGFTAVLDDIIVGEQVDDLLDEFAATPFLFVRLAPDLETVRARERERGTMLWPEWEWLSEAALEPIPFGLRIDSSRQTPDETVDEIMRRAWSEAVVAPGDVARARSAR